MAALPRLAVVKLLVEPTYGLLVFVLVVEVIKEIDDDFEAFDHCLKLRFKNLHEVFGSELLKV